MLRWVVAAVVVLTSVHGQAQTAPDKSAGQAKYQALCVSCHGAGGKGDGMAAAALTPKPRDLSDGAYMKPKADADLKKVILEGGLAVGKSPLMPAWRTTLSDQDAENIVAYIRTFVAQ